MSNERMDAASGVRSAHRLSLDEAPDCPVHLPHCCGRRGGAVAHGLAEPGPRSASCRRRRQPGATVRRADRRLHHHSGTSAATGVVGRGAAGPGGASWHCRRRCIADGRCAHERCCAASRCDGSSTSTPVIPDQDSSASRVLRCLVAFSDQARICRAMKV